MDNWIKFGNSFIRPSSVVQVDLIHKESYGEPVRVALKLADGSQIEVPYERYEEIKDKLTKG